MSKKARLKSDKRITISWWEAWLTALTKPNLVNYESIAKNPDITVKRAYLWIGVSGFVVAVIITAMLILGGRFTDHSEQSAVMCFLVLFPLIAVILFTIIFWITIAITNAIAKRLGGVGEVEELIRIVAAFTAPWFIISAAFTAPLLIMDMIIYQFPMVPIQFLSMGFGVYRTGLDILSVKAVYRIGWGKATISSILPVSMIIWSIVSFLRSVV